MEDIRNIKGLVPLPHGWWWLCLLLLAAAVAFWLWTRRKSTPARETVLPLSAYEVALRALRQLREENPPVEQFYTQLSDIVRQYLEGQLGLRAPERTTEEFLYEVSRDHSLSTEHGELLGAFLQESDLVKFAKFLPGTDDMNRAFDAAEKFVNESWGRASLPASPGNELTARQEPRPPEVATV